MATSKVNSNPYNGDVQQRVQSTKRTTMTSADQIIENNPLQPKSQHATRSTKQKQQSRQEMPGDYIRKDPNEDADEESTSVCAIMKKNQTPNECIHQLSIPSNNSAVQQGMGDHYHTSTKQHKNRTKTTGLIHRKYHRLIEEEEEDLGTSFNERSVYRWRIFMYIIILLVLVFVIYRFLRAVWPKRKKTLMEQFIDDLTNIFTA